MASGFPRKGLPYPPYEVTLPGGRIDLVIITRVEDEAKDLLGFCVFSIDISSRMGTEHPVEQDFPLNSRARKVRYCRDVQNPAEWARCRIVKPAPSQAPHRTGQAGDHLPAAISCLIALCTFMSPHRSDPPDRLSTEGKNR